MAEVVVFNKNSIIPLRHIVTINEPYDEATFKSWYYNNYHKIDGDEFIYFYTSNERNTFVENLKKI